MTNFSPNKKRNETIDSVCAEYSPIHFLYFPTTTTFYCFLSLSLSLSLAFAALSLSLSSDCERPKSVIAGNSPVTGGARASCSTRPWWTAPGLPSSCPSAPPSLTAGRSTNAPSWRQHFSSWLRWALSICWRRCWTTRLWCRTMTTGKMRYQCSWTVRSASYSGCSWYGELG